MNTKKFAFSLFVGFIMSSLSLSAFDGFCQGGSIEGRVGYLYPTNHTTRDICSGNALYSLEGNLEICNQFYLWASGGYFQQSGHTTGGDKTKLEMVPIGVGIKYFFPMEPFNFYVGGGALPTYVWSHTNSSYLTSKFNKWGCGGVVKGGVLIDLSCSFFIDVFVDYMILSIKGKGSTDPLAYSVSCNLNSVVVGAGIGYRF